MGFKLMKISSQPEISIGSLEFPPASEFYLIYEYNQNELTSFGRFDTSSQFLDGDTLNESQKMKLSFTEDEMLSCWSGEMKNISYNLVYECFTQEEMVDYLKSL